MCVCYMHISVQVCMAVHRHEKVRGGVRYHPLSLCVLLHGDKVPHCTGSWLASKFLGSTSFCSLVLVREECIATLAF